LKFVKYATGDEFGILLLVQLGIIYFYILHDNNNNNNNNNNKRTCKE